MQDEECLLTMSAVLGNSASPKLLRYAARFQCDQSVLLQLKPCEVSTSKLAVHQPHTVGCCDSKFER